MERSQIVQMEQIALIAASVTIAKHRGGGAGGLGQLTRLRPLRRHTVQVIAVIGLSMGYATSTPVMESSQIAQMEQIAPIAASVT